MEVVRDQADNCIIVCSIENIDPMGVHTGDSITVAPALTLTDKEYQIMRDASIAVLREIGVETGGSNVQFAINPAERAHDRDRDEPARVALLGAGLEGDGLPDRQGRGEARGRLHARRDRQRHHGRRDPGLLRADHRLRRHQDPALRLREVPGRRADADHRDEVGRRGDGDRPHLPGIPAEGPALARDRPHRPRRDRDRGPRQGRRPQRHQGGARHADAGPAPQGRRRPCASASATTRSTNPARSTAGSWSSCRTIVDLEAKVKAHGLPRTPGAFRQLKAMGFSDARLAVLAGTTEAEVRALRRVARRAPGLQAHRHLRGRVRLADRLHVLDLRGALRGRAGRRGRGPRTRARSSSSAAGRTASARASSSTIAAATPASR